MTLTTSPPVFDARASLRFPADLRLTCEQFELVCAENREAVLELDADGRLIAMTPTGSETGSRNGELFFQLKLFASRAGGWKAFDSSTGFRLPDGSVFSPDASLIRLDRWQALSPEERCGFAPPPRPDGPSQQDDGLPNQWCPPGLAADSPGAGRGGVSGVWNPATARAA